MSNVGSGFKKVYAQCDMSFPDAKDVPGTDFQLKSPDQIPVVPVLFNKSTGRVTINGDGHHTFVAA